MGGIVLRITQVSVQKRSQTPVATRDRKKDSPKHSQIRRWRRAASGIYMKEEDSTRSLRQNGFTVGGQAGGGRQGKGSSSYQSGSRHRFELGI